MATNGGNPDPVNNAGGTLSADPCPLCGEPVKHLAKHLPKCDNA